jgi:hypothetical protein
MKRGLKKADYSGFIIKPADLLKSKSAQHVVGLPFSVIFAIFLIVVFIVIAFIAINYFLDIGECSQIGEFYNELQEEVNEVWASQESSVNFEININSGITRICFSNLSEEMTGNQEDYEQIKNYEVYKANLFLIPPEKTCNMPYKFIKHINISEITKDKNPYCINTNQILKIKKGFYDSEALIE